MTISDEDKKHIETFVRELEWSAHEIFKYSEKKNKNWKKSTVYRLVKKIQNTGTSTRKNGSGRPSYIRHNSTFIDEILKLSQNNDKKQSPRKIAKAMGISHGSVRHILKDVEKDSSDKKQTKKSNKTTVESQKLDVTSK